MPHQPPALSLPARLELVKVDPCIRSSFKGSDGTYWSLSKLSTFTGYAPPDHAEALLKLHHLVEGAGGTLYATELWRDRTVSDREHAKWARWQEDQKNGVAFNKAKHRKAYAKPGGLSNHNAGRAADFWVTDRSDSGARVPVMFPGLPANKNLDKLWELAMPLGFTPIIDYPDENREESWHMDFMGPWTHVQERRGVDEAAMAACLDVGLGGYPGDRDLARALQAQVHRCGQDIGKIDGYLGGKTKEGLRCLGLPEDTTDPCELFGLPTAAYG